MGPDLTPGEVFSLFHTRITVDTWVRIKAIEGYSEGHEVDGFAIVYPFYNNLGEELLEMFNSWGFTQAATLNDSVILRANPLRKDEILYIQLFPIEQKVVVMLIRVKP